jgi:hypothetical protein
MMRTTITAAMAIAAGTAFGTPDVICGSLDAVNNYGTVGGIRAYSVGTTACNIGTSPANWIDGTPNHPVIGVTIWKYDNETQRLMQLGVTQLKHSFASLQGTVCSPCSGDGDFSHLGSGCSDPYGAGLNGTQGDLGPRSEVNPYTAEFVYPYTGINQSGNAIFKRIQVKQADIQDSTATFYVEGIYTNKDDYAAGTNMNNVSYKRLNISQSSFNASTTGQTFREQPVMNAWQVHNPDLMIESIDMVPEDGRLIVGSRVTDLGGGMYRYDYGVYNQNSDRAVASVSIPVNTATSGHFFHDIDYHSTVDENISGADWSVTEGSGSITWSTQTESQNVWANAIRWGTMYNFSFETDSPPVEGEVTLGTFKDGMSLTVGAMVPQGAPDCPADFTGDGELDFFDLSAFLSALSQNKPVADFSGDGQYDFFDVSAYLQAFNMGCP